MPHAHTHKHPAKNDESYYILETMGETTRLVETLAVVGSAGSMLLLLSQPFGN